MSVEKGYPEQILQTLNEYRRSGQFCDVTIVVQGRQFPAHRAVLSAGGGFFNGLFGADMKEKTQDSIELKLGSPDVVDDILSYVYTGGIGVELTQDNAQSIIETADYLLLPALKNKADEFLSEESFDPIDFISMYNFAMRYKCSCLEDSLFDLIVENFETALDLEDFLEFPGEELIKMVASEDRVIHDEEVVFRAIVTWTKHKENRLNFFDDLFQGIRLKSLSNEFLFSVVITEQLVLSSSACLKLIALQHFNIVASYSEFLEFDLDTLHEIVASDDLIVTSEETVFKAVIDWVNHKDGRKDSITLLLSNIRPNSISQEFLQSHMETDTLVSSNPECLIDKINNLVYDPLSVKDQHPRKCLDDHTDAILVFAANSDYGLGTRMPYCYVPTEKKWYIFPGRCEDDNELEYGIPLSYKGSVYLVKPFSTGGSHIFRYDRESKVWVEIAEGLTWTIAEPEDSIKGYNAACLHGVIYTVGGEFVNRHYVKTTVNEVHACDITIGPNDDFLPIVPVAPMNEARAGACALVDEKYLYVLGGHRYDNNQQPIFTNTVEKYDPCKNSWEYLSPMKQRPDCSGDYLYALSSDKIYVCQVSKSPDENVADSVEIYDVPTDTWSEIHFEQDRYYYDSIKGLLIPCNNELYHINLFFGLEVVVMDTTCYNIKKKSWRTDSLAKSRVRNYHPSIFGNVSLFGTIFRLAKKDLASLELATRLDEDST